MRDTDSREGAKPRSLDERWTILDITVFISADACYDIVTVGRFKFQLTIDPLPQYGKSYNYFLD